MVLLALSFTPATAEDNAELGEELTPMGAKKASNSDTIPAYRGGFTATQSSDFAPEDPFNEDQELFRIDQDNVNDYRDHLSPGQVAMIKTYDDYFIPVYKTRRTAAYPEAIEEQTMANDGRVKLVENGNGLKNYESATPFPKPENGLEAIWNHVTRYRGGSLQRNIARTTPEADGDFTVTRVTEDLAYPTALVDYDPDHHDNILFYYRQKVTAPSRLSGNILLVHETINQLREPRQSWFYNSGHKRVRKLPGAGYDAQGGGTDGHATADNLDMFNGATDRYEWELKGKKEMFIPYNAYQLADRDLSYDDIIQASHINPELTRYERHRVWHVRATLKDDKSHVYSRRDFYIDEDSWQIAVVDHYDGRGDLWRVAEAHMLQLPEPKVPAYAFEALYDLRSGRYVINGLTNEERNPYQFDKKYRYRQFTPAALRRSHR
jgi:hypothetical protein